MAAKFVRSGAAGAGTGADWANAYTTIALAIAGISAGDILWIADDHNESTAGAVAWTFPGTIGNPNFCYCADHTVASPGTGDLKLTGLASTSGGNSITMAGSAYWYGMTPQVGSAANNASINILTTASQNAQMVFDSCGLALIGTGASSIIAFGGTAASSPARVNLTNTTMRFAATGQGITLRNTHLQWRNTASALLGTIPTTLISASTFRGMAFIEGVDLSAAGSGKTLVGALAAGSRIYLKDCQLGASVTVAATPTNAEQETYVTNSDSGATNYRSEKYAYRGTETTETTIVRTGGASDGTMPQSRKIVTTANSLWVMPFESMTPIPVWVDSTGSKTFTVHAVSGAAGGLNNDDIWIQVEYPGSASVPLASFASSTKANNLATGSAYSASGASWAGSPSGTPFSMAVTVTLNAKGLVFVYVRAAKASMTVYVDTKIVVT